MTFLGFAFRYLGMVGLVLICPVLLSGKALAGEGGHAAAFERLKSLAGTWKGAKEDGGAVSLTYAVVSEGSVVMETLAEDTHSMITMYHMDGDKLMMTHYCAAGNQPRMVATQLNGGQITFAYKDVTNLADADAGHMRQLVLYLPEEKEKLAAHWTWRQGGQDDHTAIFKVTRAE